MAGSKSDWAENHVLLYFLTEGALTRPSLSTADTYVALGTEASDGAFTEVSTDDYTNYARKVVYTDGASTPFWGQVGANSALGASDTAAENRGSPGTITYAVGVAGDAVTVDKFAVYTLVTGGNPIYYGDLTNPSSLAVAEGITPEFALGGIDISEL